MATKSIRLSDGTDTLLPESAESGALYCKMADGTLIQWGTATIPANSASRTVVFPISFISATYGISIMGNYGNSRDLSWAFAGQSGSQITIYKGMSDISYAQYFHWLVIGRWK